MSVKTKSLHLIYMQVYLANLDGIRIIFYSNLIDKISRNLIKTFNVGIEPRPSRLRVQPCYTELMGCN
jgi:hypothetical protein